MDLSGFLQLLQGVRRSGSGHVARCPAHDDKRQSLSITAGKDGRILLRCHAGCEWKAVVDALRIPASDLFAESRSINRSRAKQAQAANFEQRTIVATYDYEDLDGTLLYQAVRLEPKAFYQRVPHPTLDGRWLLGTTPGWYVDRGETWRKVGDDRTKSPEAGAEWIEIPARRVLYRLPGLDAIKPVRLFIVEGEKDADALWAIGLHATTSVAGAGKWRPWANEYAQQVLTLGPHQVICLPDNDDAGRRHMADVAESLEAVGITVAWVELSGVPEKGDVSDWLKQGHGMQALLDLVDGHAQAPPKVERRGPAEPAPGVPPIPDGLGYGLDDLGRLSTVRTSGQGQNQQTLIDPLGTFDAWIVEEIRRDDGVEVSLEYAIQGRSADGDFLDRVVVPAEKFAGLSWVPKAWGTAATIYQGQAKADHLRTAIALRSTPLKRKTFSHTGWRLLGNRWCYLHAGGAIGEPTAIVDLGSAFTRFRLPEYDAIKARDGTKLSWSLMRRLAPLRVMAPLWSAVWRAPLCEAKATDFSLVMLGSTGIMKSSLAAVALCHYGNFPNKTSFPEAWLSSAGAMEDLAFRLKDMLCPLDDYVKQAGDKEIESKGTRIIRAQGNQTSRGRLNADLTRRESRPPRGLILLTAEGMPPGESVAARTFAVEMKAGDVVLKALDEAQSPRAIHLLGHAMAGYTSWLAERIGEPEFKASLEERFRTVRAQIRGASGGVHARVPENAANLLIGAEIGAAYAVHVDAMSQAEADALLVECREAVASLIAAQGREIGSRKPTMMFLELLQSCLLAKRVCFARTLDAMNDGTKGGPVPVGWASDAKLYLLPAEGINSVYKAIRDSGESFAIDPRRIMTELAEQGIVETDKEGNTAKVVKSSGRSVRAYVLLREAVERAMGHEIVVPGVDTGFDATSGPSGDDDRAPF